MVHAGDFSSADSRLASAVTLPNPEASMTPRNRMALTLVLCTSSFTGCEHRGENAGTTFSPVNYTVSGTIPPILQEKSNSCWAATWAMLYSWKQKGTIRERDAVGALGKRFVDLWTEDIGFGIEDTDPFLEVSGLVAEAPGNPNAAGWESLLRRNGPLWVTSREAGARGNHARVMMGITGDGSPEATFVDLINPATGKRGSVQYAQFAADFEREARVLTKNPKLPLQIQVYHW
jgi:hypothetical protein